MFIMSAPQSRITLFLALEAATAMLLTRMTTTMAKTTKQSVSEWPWTVTSDARMVGDCVRSWSLSRSLPLYLWWWLQNMKASHGVVRAATLLILNLTTLPRCMLLQLLSLLDCRFFSAIVKLAQSHTYINPCRAIHLQVCCRREFVLTHLNTSFPGGQIRMFEWNRSSEYETYTER